jgi:hypothetical protein
MNSRNNIPDINPAEKESDRGYWTKTDVELFPLVTDLHRLIRENSHDEQAFIKPRTLSNGIHINKN